MQAITNSTTTQGMMTAVVIGVFLVGLGVGFGVFSGSPSTFEKQIEDQNARIADLESELKSTTEQISTNDKIASLEAELRSTNERIIALEEAMDMIFSGMVPGDMMGPFEDMMSQEPLDVIIKTNPDQTIWVGKEAEITLLVLDKVTKEPLEGVQVLIGIERGSSLGTMEMMGDLFGAEDKGAGEYAVRFTPDIEGLYVIHTMVMLPGRGMADNHMDFELIAQASNI